MTPERLQQLISSYGADVDRWPRAEREAARRLLADSPSLQAELAAERDLDALLDRWNAPGPSTLLAPRIMREVGRRSQPGRHGGIPIRRLAPQVAALAAALALGFFVGINGLGLNDQQEGVDLGGLVLGNAALEAWQ